MKVEPWWIDCPTVFEQETGALESAGIPFEIDEEAKKNGVIKIDIRLNILGKLRNAYISYPDLYPYFRPTLVAPGLGGNLRHYNPVDGQICLLTRGSEQWQPRETAAEFIDEMLGHWEKAAVRGYEEIRMPREDEQAEPITAYHGNGTQQIMMDSDWVIPEGVAGGSLKLAIPNGYKSIQKDEPFVGWALGVDDDSGKPVEGAVINSNLHSCVKSGRTKKVECSWVRLSKIPTSLESIFRHMESDAPKQFIWLTKQLKTRGNSFFAVCAPEEGPHGIRDGWMFYYLTRHAKGVAGKFLAVEYAGEKDLLERIPELAPLQGKTIAVVGLGCVGAPSVLSFARAGVGEIRLLDGDHVSPGTICRWPFGLQSVGAGKVKALIDFIHANYPLTKIGIDHHMTRKEDFKLTIGGSGGGFNQKECLCRLLDGVDLLYDATAEEGVNHMLSDMAKKHLIPYIGVASRPGGWGGNVVRIRPSDERGCLLCYLHGLADESIPQPVFDPEGDKLQPTGCGDVTFKAAGFDVEEISLVGVRMAVSTLCEESENGYPAIVSDVGILSLRQEGQVIFPHWESSSLEKHPKCERCAAL